MGERGLRARLRRWLSGESVEVVLAGVWFPFDVFMVASGWGSVWTLVTSAVVCVGAAISGWWPRTAVAVTTLGLVGQNLLPPDHVGISMFACGASLLALVARRRWRLAGLAAVIFLVPITYYTMVAASGQLNDRLLSQLGWLFFFAVATALGAALGQARRSGEALAQQLLDSQRRQIAIDLHDNVSHDLSMIVMRVEQARLRGEVVPEDLGEISDAARRSSRYLRQMMTLMSVGDEHDPELLDLATTLASCREELVARGFHATLQADPFPEELPVAVGDALAKVAREATNNVLRHGDVRQPCSIMLLPASDRLELLVSNGVAEGARRGSGLGLSGMRERLVGLGGRLDVRESPRLWVVRVSVPL